MTTQREHGSAIKGLLTLSNGSLLSWSQASDEARIWDAGGRLAHALVSDAEVDGVREMRDGRLLGWALNRRLYLWDSAGTPLHTMERHHGHITDVLELQNGRILSWGHDHKPRLWTSAGSPIRLLAAHGGQVWGMLELGDGRLFSWASHTYPRLWSPDGDLLRTLRHWSWPSRTNFIRLHDDRFAYWSNAVELHIVNVDEDEVSLYPRNEYTPATNGAIELSDGRLLSWSGDFDMYSISGGKTTHLHEHDYALRLWNANGQLVKKLDGHASPILGAVELKNGRILSWSKDGELKLWSVDGLLKSLWRVGWLRRMTRKHSVVVRGTCQLGDDCFVTWSQDGMLRLWDKEGKPVAQFRGEASILHCAVTQDRQTIIAGDAQGQLMFLQVP